MNEIDPELRKKLSNLKAVPDRDPRKAFEARKAFLDEANILGRSVSIARNERHTEWQQKIQSVFVFRRKERSPMANLIITIMLAVSMILGTGAVTVAASNGSLPDQPLYEVKLLKENVVMDLTSDPVSQFDLSLEYVANRGDEIQTILENGGTPSEEVMTRYKNQIEQAMTFAVGLTDEKAIQALERLQIRLETQMQTYLQLQVNKTTETEASLARVQTMMRERVEMIEVGQTNLVMLRNQVQLQQQLNNPGNGQATEAPGSGAPVGTGQGNPWAEGTPTPGSEYGPGPGTSDCATCTPQMDGQQNYPWTVGTYGFGDYGNGDVSQYGYSTQTPYQNGQH